MNRINTVLLLTWNETGNETSCITTQKDDFEEVLNRVKEKSDTEVIEVEECISDKGEIVCELRENVINDILRKIYTIRPTTILVCFINSNQNTVHEKTFQNLLATAGYKSVYISSDREQFISILSVMFAKSKDE